MRRSIAAGVVEGDRDREVAHRLRDARAVGQRGEVLAVADLLVGQRRSRPSRRRGGRGRSRRSSRSCRCPVSARAIRIASIVASEPEFTKRQRSSPKRCARSSATTMASSVTAAKWVPERRPRPQRLHDRGVGVALDHRAEAVVEVPVAVAVDVGDARPLAGDEVDRPRVAQLVGGGDAAAERAPGALVHRRRALRALVQRRELAARELLHTLVSICTVLLTAMTDGLS